MTPEGAIQTARHAAWANDQPAYVYWEGDAFTGGLQVYCGPYDLKAPAPVLRGYDVFAIVLPGGSGDLTTVLYQHPQADNR